MLQGWLLDLAGSLPVAPVLILLCNEHYIRWYLLGLLLLCNLASFLLGLRPLQRPVRVCISDGA